MGYKLIQPPQDEPVSLAEAKLHMNVRDGDTRKDALIEMLIASCREHAETITHAAFVTQQWRLTLDGFPGGCPILLQKTPVQSVDSIVYTDMSGQSQTLVEGTDYVVDLDSEPARITPPFGAVWPIPLPQIGVVKVTFTAGFGEPGDVPECVKTWIRERVTTLFDNPADIVIEGSRATVAALPFLDRLLDPVTVPLV